LSPPAREKGDAVRLRYVDPQIPGYSRRRRGRGFEYLDPEGRTPDDVTLERVRALAIPPAWTDVWICPWPNGHLQATGRDAAGRLQYLYHEAWRAERDGEKFERMLDFARSLPRLRPRVAEGLADRQLTKTRLLACATRLLDRGFFRIGGEAYADRNGTFGLATLRKRHVSLGRDGSLRFSYVAKGGKRRTLRLVDSEVRAVLDALKRRNRRPELFGYRNGRGWTAIRSNDVNAYIRDVSGGPFSAKDFRTWHATVLAGVSVAVLGERATTETARRRVVAQAAKEVAGYLGNTPAVCRESYIDPRIFEHFYAGETIQLDLESLAEPSLGGELLATERAVLDLLSG
jgi:DNA topoisomerase IB